MKMKRCVIILGAGILIIGFFVGACFGAGEDARFKGGSYDGYDRCSKTNTTIQSGIIPAGTIFMLR